MPTVDKWLNSGWKKRSLGRACNDRTAQSGHRVRRKENQNPYQYWLALCKL